jgi:hypothetical protein
MDHDADPPAIYLFHEEVTIVTAPDTPRAVDGLVRMACDNCDLLLLLGTMLATFALCQYRRRAAPPAAVVVAEEVEEEGGWRKA